MTCEKCRAWNESPDATFCGKCGAKLQAPKYIRRAKLGRKTLMWFGIVYGSLFVLVCVGVALYGHFAASPANSTAAIGNTTKLTTAPARNTASTRRTTTAPTTQSVVPTISNQQPTQQAAACTPNWQCNDWNTCTGNGAGGGEQTRSCSDFNSCGTTVGEPPTQQSCSCVPNWQCSIWNPCPEPPYPGAPLPSGGNVATRSCTDENRCGTSAGEPPTTQSCQ